MPPSWRVGWDLIEGGAKIFTDRGRTIDPIVASAACVLKEMRASVKRWRTARIYVNTGLSALLEQAFSRAQRARIAHRKAHLFKAFGQ